ncbi:hypothetical protein Cs7R123_09030 [Catellatospora sp. TT07R-123]|uniref:CU044_2847 family protein n=1 Tax=Catellatospora sp. TT07R-123 TaxID=2733863 RepID=UPI001B06802C|nr:CU044_2847 family protein [Catellatospora sp. TT07R-123]GHJ43561.1 hypothetical protein Cs7R123_09030 [Catellatospora sp. TT07R-123]
MPILEFSTADGGHVYVEGEVLDMPTGPQRASPRGKAIVVVGRAFGEALGQARDAAVEALRTFRQGDLDPDEIELEFGVRLTAEAGAVIAKTAAEGSLTVRLRWEGKRSSNNE